MQDLIMEGFCMNLAHVCKRYRPDLLPALAGAGGIVHKTHITYGLSAAKMARIKRDLARQLLLRALARSAAFLTKILGLCPAR
ncbi:hypothetical protein J3P84_11025 [Pseudomonas sp. Z1-29]|uniref:hypothetical protein n=2 Tax=unclassified Pseudomonas TaxID=196821 RepID=UPI003DA90CA9